VGNALQHSPPNTPVTISLVDTPEKIVLSVANLHHHAIEEEAQKHIFEPFRRGKESTGLGLGLYIVKQIAEAHGGAVAVRSQCEVTTFSVQLPRQDASRPSSNTAPV